MISMINRKERSSISHSNQKLNDVVKLNDAVWMNINGDKERRSHEDKENHPKWSNSCKKTGNSYESWEAKFSA